MTEETAREAANQIRTLIDKARSVAQQQEDKAKEMDDTLTVTSSGIKYSKSVRAFTEQGVAMLSSVLNSNRAIQVNIQIMRAFTKLRQMLATHDDLRRKIEEMEQKYDQQFQVVFDASKCRDLHTIPDIFYNVRQHENQSQRTRDRNNPPHGHRSAGRSGNLRDYQSPALFPGAKRPG